MTSKPLVATLVAIVFVGSALSVGYTTGAFTDTEELEVTVAGNVSVDEYEGGPPNGDARGPLMTAVRTTLIRRVRPVRQSQQDVVATNASRTERRTVRQLPRRIPVTGLAPKPTRRPAPTKAAATKTRLK